MCSFSPYRVESLGRVRVEHASLTASQRQGFVGSRDRPDRHLTFGHDALESIKEGGFSCHTVRPELPHVELAQNKAQAADVIQLRMRGHNHIKPPNASIPEQRRDHHASRIISVGCASPINEHGAAIRRLDQSSIPLPHVEERGSERPRSRQVTRRPDPEQQHPPSQYPGETTSPAPPPEQGGPEQQKEPGYLPERRRSDPQLSPRHSSKRPHDPHERLQQGTYHDGADQLPSRSAQQGRQTHQQPDRQHDESDKRDYQQVRQPSHPCQLIEIRRHEGSGCQGDDQAHEQDIYRSSLQGLPRPAFSGSTGNPLLVTRTTDLHQHDDDQHREERQLERNIERRQGVPPHNDHERQREAVPNAVAPAYQYGGEGDKGHDQR